MPQWHGDIDKRKKSGGRRRAYRGKRAFEMGGDPTETVVGERRLFSGRTKGGRAKLKLFATNVANVTDPATGKTSKTEITRVVRNPANVDYQRRGVLTKGSIIDTPAGQARVTSRPGQDGIVNAVLIPKSEK